MHEVHGFTQLTESETKPMCNKDDITPLDCGYEILRRLKARSPTVFKKSLEYLMAQLKSLSQPTENKEHRS